MGCSSSDNIIKPEIVCQNKVATVKEVKKKTEIIPK